jgi:chorismate mutase
MKDFGKIHKLEIKIKRLNQKISNLIFKREKLKKEIAELFG